MCVCVCVCTCNWFSLCSQKDHIYSNCKTIYNDCQKLIAEVTYKVKGQLHPFLSRLSQVWRLRQTSENLLRACSTLDVVLGQVFMERSEVLVRVVFCFFTGLYDYYKGATDQN